MRNIVVSAGRNVGDEPMSAERWAAFRLSICALFPHRIFTGTGIGEYEGAREESFTVVAPFTPGDWAMSASPELYVRYVRAHLANLAKEYGQECIALTIAEPDLVTPESSKESGHVAA